MTYWPGTTHAVRDRAGSVDPAEVAYGRQQEKSSAPRISFATNIAGQKTKQTQAAANSSTAWSVSERPASSTQFQTAPAFGEARRQRIVLDSRGPDKRFGGTRVVRRSGFAARARRQGGNCRSNGAGKTTLLKMLAGKLGRRRHGTPGRGDRPGLLRPRTRSGRQPTVLEEIWRMDRNQTEEMVRSCLGGFGFGADFVDRPVRVLSGGQRNRLGLREVDAHAAQFSGARRTHESSRPGFGGIAGGWPPPLRGHAVAGIARPAVAVARRQQAAHRGGGALAAVPWRL